MRVEIRFQLSSREVVWTEVESTYQKGDLFCARMKDGLTVKYPLASIFDVREFSRQ